MEKPQTVLSDAELLSVRLFRDLSLTDLRPALASCPVEICPAGVTLLSTDVANHRLYIVLSGRLRVQLSSDSDIPLAIVENGDCIGEVSVIDSQPVTAEVIAEETSRLLVIDQPVFWQLIDRFPAFNRNLLAILAERFRNGNRFLSDYAHRSTVDPLTGLYNRRWLENFLPRQIRYCRHQRRPLVVLMVDVDHFKNINDTYGHRVGDRILRRIADRLRQHLRAEDKVVRYGGEEMTVILPDSDRLIGLRTAERLLTAISASPLDGGNGIYAHNTVSIGLAQLRDDELDTELLSRADQALYRAKRAGRNRVITD